MRRHGTSTVASLAVSRSRRTKGAARAATGKTSRGSSAGPSSTPDVASVTRVPRMPPAAATDSGDLASEDVTGENAIYVLCRFDAVATTFLDLTALMVIIISVDF